MLKLVTEFDKLKDYGFHRFKKGVVITWYKAHSRGVKSILINTKTRIINIDKWHKSDNRIHKTPKCRYRSNSLVYDTLYDLIKDGLVIKEETK